MIIEIFDTIGKVVVTVRKYIGFGILSTIYPRFYKSVDTQRIKLKFDVVLTLFCYVLAVPLYRRCLLVGISN